MKNISDPTTSKSQTISEQESQSDSSEDTNMTFKFLENFGNEEDNSPTLPNDGQKFYTKWKGEKSRSQLSHL